MKLSPSLTKTAKAAALIFLFTASIASSAPVAPVIVERGPHHRVLERTNARVLPDGRITQQVSSYMELATGLHYQQDGQWLDSKEEIELFQDGAIARQGQHQVIFSPNINTAGAVDLLTPDGKRFRSRILGLALFDAASGESALIAETKDAVGQVVAPNQVLWTDCFSDVEADVRAIYRKGALEVDVVLRSRIDPAAWGFAAATCRIQVWTEFFDPPVGTKQRIILRSEPDPQLRATMHSPDFADELLFFGQMHFHHGRAFAIETEAVQQAGLDADAVVPVGKEWAVIEGRSFLVESVEYPFIKPQMDTLPELAANNPQNNNARLAAKKIFKSASAMIAAVANPVIQKRAGASNEKMKLVMSRRKPGVVLDYVIMSSTNNFTFKSGITYFIGGDFTLSGTTVIEGGTVVKYTNGTLNRLLFTGPIDCRTSPYHPATFTIQGDNTIGEMIGGTTSYDGNSRALDLSLAGTTFKLHDIRVRYANSAIYLSYGSLDLSHAVLAFANVGIYNPAVRTSFWHNVLFHDLNSAVVNLGDASTNRGEHITAHRVGTFVNSGTVFLTNSLLIAVTNGVLFTGSNVQTNQSDSGIFQTVGAGAHYLANNSPYRDAGTTNISATLLAELKQRTTYPPIVITNKISLNTTLVPQAKRDTDLPDLGYLYDPLDYAINKVALTNATLTVSPGTAIGVYGGAGDYGLWLNDGADLVCEGAPDKFCRFVRYNLAQEQANTNWSSAGMGMTMTSPNWEASPYAKARFRFTDFAMPAPGEEHFNGSFGTMPMVTFQHCQFLAGRIYSDLPDMAFTNCLFERVGLYLHGLTNEFHNNLFYGGTNLVDGLSGTNIFTDNIFDDTGLNQNGGVSHSHNAYSTNVTRLTPNASSDVVTNIIYEPLLLTRYYLPTNSPLINAGKTNAGLVGLYHFTTATNQVAETNSLVDIGLHFPVTTAGGAVLDSDGDGLLNFAEDINGNGTFDSSLGETDWQNYNSLFGIGTGPGLIVFTPLK